MSSIKNRVVITTPEYVRVPFDTAGVGTRSLAKLIDIILLGIALIPIGILISALSTVLSLSTDFDLPSVLVGIVWIVFAFVPIMYFTATEYWIRGQTVGKKILKLRVIADDGKHPSFSSVFLRNLVQFIDLLPGCFLVGLIAIFVHRQEKRIGDLVAGTLVIQERQSKEDEIKLYFSARTLSEADRKQFAQLQVLSSERYLLLEAFLSRRSSLDPELRKMLGQQILQGGWPKVVVADEKVELFLEKVYLYMREVHYPAIRPFLYVV